MSSVACEARLNAAALIAPAAAGFLLALLAARLDGRGGAAQMIVQGDRTLGAVIAITAIFRMISRLSADAAQPLPHQLIAAGTARSGYTAALALCVTLASLVSYVGGAWTFAAATAMTTADYEPAIRAVITLPLIALVMFGASSFGAVAYCFAGDGGARPLAVAALALPWLTAWILATSSRGLKGLGR